MKSIVIFLNNKLIACDTITPFVVELIAQRPDYRAAFVTFDGPTYRAILRNELLSDAIARVGSLRMMGLTGKSTAAWFWHRVKMMVWIVGLLFSAWAGRTTFLHFKALNFWPLRVLGMLAPSRTIYAQGSPFGVSPLEQAVSDAMKYRRHRRTQPTGATWLAFTKDWVQLQRLSGSQSAVFAETPFRYPTWRNVTHDRADALFADALRHTRIPKPDRVASLILSSLDNDVIFDHPGRHFELLDDVLAAMERVHPDMPVMIKPHPATRPEIMTAIRNRLDRLALPHALCEIHPLVLAQKSAYAIAIGYTTAFGFFRAVGVPTVEYAFYRSDLLEISGGGSMRPDLVTHFHQGNRQALEETLRALVSISKDTVRLTPTVLDLKPFSQALA
jgi:hypothetical protein